MIRISLDPATPGTGAVAIDPPLVAGEPAWVLVTGMVPAEGHEWRLVLSTHCHDRLLSATAPLEPVTDGYGATLELATRQIAAALALCCADGTITVALELVDATARTSLCQTLAPLRNSVLAQGGTGDLPSWSVGVTVEQVEQIVAAALAPYATTEQVAAAIADALAPYATTEQVAAAIADALAPYATTAEVAAAIATALVPYATTAEVAAAISAAVPSLPLSIANGGTGATTAAAARANLGAMSATADGNTILTGGTQWDGAPIGIFADQMTSAVGTRAALGTLAPEYSESGSYEAGDVVWYTDSIYMCNASTPSPAGEFNPQLWSLVNVASLLDEKQDTISDLATIRSGAAAGATAVQPAQRNLLDYTTGTTLAPQTAVYRAALNADGTFPTVDATAIPTASAYYQFELELAVPSTVPAAITGPSGWDWLDGGEPPDPTVLSGGETIFVACRMDCATRAVTANVWRVA